MHTIEHRNDRHSNQERLSAYYRESFFVSLRDFVEAMHAFGALGMVQLSPGVDASRPPKTGGFYPL